MTGQGGCKTAVSTGSGASVLLQSIPVADDDDMSMTCRIDLQEVTRRIQGLDPKRSTIPLPRVAAPEQPVSELDLFAGETKALRFANATLLELVGGLLEGMQMPPCFNHLIEGGRLIAANIDQGPVDQPAYHNQYHVAEVVLAAYLLGKRERLSSRHTAELVVAAAAHDLWHPGSKNQSPFEIEALSSQIAEPFLRAAGWNDEEVGRVQAMILATDFVNGVPPARARYLETRHLPAHDPERILATQCQLLTEADILFSCFNQEFNEELSRLLSREWNMPHDNLPLPHRMGFLNAVKFISEASRQLGLDNRRKQLIAELESRGTEPGGA